MNRTKLLLLPDNNVQAKKPSITRICVVVDKSGSMSTFVSAVNSNLVKQFEKIVEDATGETFVSLIDFNYYSYVVFSNKSKEDGLQAVKNYEFRPNGGTALNDAVKGAIVDLEHYEGLDKERTDDWGYLVIVLTDGEENSSSISTPRIQQLINEKQQTGHWTFAFIVPTGYSNAFKRDYSLLNENVTEWSQNKKDFERVSALNTFATSGYLQQRSAGVKAVTTYFKTDLSNFDPVKSKLIDITNNFKTYKVDKETDITTFYQYKTGKTYIPAEGRCYYQLTKKEMIQPQKNIIIRDKNSKLVYGGDVRKALNMSNSQSGVNVKVDPGNHGYYDIFVQSTSPNRKLVRGTEVLVLK